ncbi:MAG: manganese efflux pump [Lachnospiraceae bacterium]|nr:manganese efflux pump [Lachnospiraceae bacterium]
MTLGFDFFFNSILLGVGLAMDAFSVSLANGLHEPAMRKRRMGLIAGIFAGFQFAMPMIGWICVSTIAQYFQAFERAIPWIALLLLCYIGGSMLLESFRGGDEEDTTPSIGMSGLFIQGVATSIDALSVGFTISDYHLLEATLACLLIGIVTFFICFAGLGIGKKAGTKLAGKAGILGGCILIFIGLEIFVTSIF